MKRDLYLLRGISGSGKTTLANALATVNVNMDEYSHVIKYRVLTADDYFMVDGNYIWDGDKLGDAHSVCYEKTKRAMIRGEEKIFVANTFTRERELKPYYELAKKFNYRVFSIVVENRHGGVDVHEVSEETLAKMRARFNIKL